MENTLEMSYNSDTHVVSYSKHSNIVNVSCGRLVMVTFTRAIKVILFPFMSVN